MGRETLLPSVFRKLGTSEYVCQVDWEMEVIRVLVINDKGFNDKGFNYKGLSDKGITK